MKKDSKIVKVGKYVTVGSAIVTSLTYTTCKMNPIANSNSLVLKIGSFAISCAIARFVSDKVGEFYDDIVDLVVDISGKDEKKEDAVG